MINHKTHYLWFVLITSFAWNTPIEAQNTEKDIFEAQCVSCHAISHGTPQSLKELWDKKGPSLSSAGIKYKPEWLKEWLQNPVRIRPTVTFYGNHIKKGKKSDEIDQEGLADHPKLSGEEAMKITEMLMGLKENRDMVKSGEYKPGTISLSLGEMMFDKFKGCLACHQIEPGYGGLSGPEVYTAASRLQEDYLISFMRNPQAWQPKTIMPNKNLKESDLQKMVHYFRALSQENFK